MRSLQRIGICYATASLDYVSAEIGLKDSPFLPPFLPPLSPISLSPARSLTLHSCNDRPAARQPANGRSCRLADYPQDKISLLNAGEGGPMNTSLTYLRTRTMQACRKA